MLPFTPEQFLNVFATYNQAVWPLQVVLILLAGAAVFLAVKPNSCSNQLITGLLAFLWLWTGVAYHLAFFTRINRGAYAFGALCIVQAVFFLFAGVVRRDLIFQAWGNAVGVIGGLFIVYALLVYPALGYAMGHRYPVAPTFGAPCPTTIFTFGLLLWVEERMSRYVLWIPLLWSLIGAFAAVFLGIWEDAGLPVAGIVGTTLILWRNRRMTRPMHTRVWPRLGV
jgi:hypothetical protein